MKTSCGIINLTVTIRAVRVIYLDDFTRAGVTWLEKPQVKGNITRGLPDRPAAIFTEILEPPLVIFRQPARNDFFGYLP